MVRYGIKTSSYVGIKNRNSIPREYKDTDPLNLFFKKTQITFMLLYA